MTESPPPIQNFKRRKRRPPPPSFWTLGPGVNGPNILVAILVTVFLLGGWFVYDYYLYREWQQTNDEIIDIHRENMRRINEAELEAIRSR